MAVPLSWVACGLEGGYCTVCVILFATVFVFLLVSCLVLESILYIILIHSHRLITAVFVLACLFTGFWMLLSVLEGFIGCPLAGVDSGPLPASFVPYPVGCLCTTDLCMGVFCGTYCYESFYWGPCCNMASNILLSLVVSLSFIWFPAFVSLYMWKLSKVYSILPFPVMWMTFFLSSMLSMACPSSSRCWANFDFLSYLKSLMCSLNQVLNDLPVCPVYIFLQSGQVSWYIPHFSYIGWGVFVHRLGVC